MANNFLSPYAAYGGRSPQLSPRGVSPEPGPAYGVWYDQQYYQHPGAMDPYLAYHSALSPNRLSPDPTRMHPQHSPSFHGAAAAHHVHFGPNNMDFYGAFPLNNNYTWSINNNNIVYTDDEEINTNMPGLFYSANSQPPPHQVVPPANDPPRSAAQALPRPPAPVVHQLALPTPEKKDRKEKHKEKQEKKQLKKQDSKEEDKQKGKKSPDDLKSPSTASTPRSRLPSSDSQTQLTRSQTSGSLKRTKSRPERIPLTRYRGSERLPFAAVGMRRAWQMEVTTGAIFLLVGIICILVDLADNYEVGSMFVGCGLAAFGVVFIITGFVWRDQIKRKKARRAGAGAGPYAELCNEAITPTTPSKEFSDGLITP